jgi:Aminoglycoside-2''-adenylyltransferase
VQPDIEAWDPWHPREFAAHMEGSAVPWFVAGGWAIDLFLGRCTRDHEDLEIAVPSSVFEAIPPLFPEFDFWVPNGERKLARMSIETLAGESHQTWAYDRAAKVWRFDVFREPHKGDTWICRRDTSIRRPYAEVFDLSADGIPYLRPEICLLFKAKAVRDKDRMDFEATLSRMSATQRMWLHAALKRVHPDHDWISATEFVE